MAPAIWSTESERHKNRDIKSRTGFQYDFLCELPKLATVFSPQPQPQQQWLQNVFFLKGRKWLRMIAATATA